MANNVLITDGSGTSSVAAEQIGNTKYQIIKLVGGETGSTSVLGVNPDRSINVSVIGIPTFSAAGGSVGLLGGTAFIGNVGISSGSVLAIANGNQSVSGTVGASVIGNVNTTITSIATIGGFINVNLIGGSVLTSSTPNQSVSGTVGASIIGLAPVSVSNFPTTQNVSGSVVGFQGTSPWVETFTNSSILAVPVGSVISVSIGSVITAWQAPSIVGTYAEDSPSANADKGLFSLNVRNDTLTSITSADGDYSGMSVGPSGEVIVANAPLTKWVQGNASLFTGIIQPIIAAQGASVFTYITGVQVANASANNAYITFFGATGSVVGYTPAPANGGSNIVLLNAWKGNANGAFSASVSGVASVYLSAEGFISKS